MVPLFLGYCLGFKDDLDSFLVSAEVELLLSKCPGELERSNVWYQVDTYSGVCDCPRIIFLLDRPINWTWACLLFSSVLSNPGISGGHDGSGQNGERNRRWSRNGF